MGLFHLSDKTCSYLANSFFEVVSQHKQRRVRASSRLIFKTNDGNFKLQRHPTNLISKAVSNLNWSDIIF